MIDCPYGHRIISTNYNVRECYVREDGRAEPYFSLKGQQCEHEDVRHTTCEKFIRTHFATTL